MIIGADVGGTFTDIVAVRADGRVTIRKVPTTPDPSDGVRQALEDLVPAGGADALVHGTTVATNALLERAGAQTVLVTDAGFEDILEIGRQDRPALYDPNADRPTALVDRRDRLGIGPNMELPDHPGADAIAVALVRGHVEREREAAVAEAVRSRFPDTPISCSSVVAPEFREFERTSTTVLNAYLSPVTAAYLRRLDRQITSASLARTVSVMRSSGGLMAVEEAASLPAAILLSGPAGGVVAADAVAADIGASSVISFDMGGTSTDVCLIADGRIDVSYERSIAGFACRMPAVGVHTVGAGGGSIAWIDPGGALRVGPRSAGAHPGPACYGRGGVTPTVTDADVVLGRIDAEARLGGTLTISPDPARRAVRTIADRLGLSIEAAALGILDIATETMAGAVRTVSVAAGHDPRSSHLVAFGGAGGLHASAVARRLGMAGVVVPPAAGVLSAVGLLLSPPRSDAVRAVLVTDGDLTPVRSAAEDLAASVVAPLSVVGARHTTTEFILDVRYAGQAHELAVPWARVDGMAEVRSAFERRHRARYGFDRPGDDIEIVAIRIAVVGAPSLVTMPGATEPTTSRHDARAIVGHDGVSRRTRIMDRTGLAASGTVEGPVLIEERDTTVYVDHDERARLTASGAIEVTW